MLCMRFYIFGKNYCVKYNTHFSTRVKVVYFILIHSIVLYYKCSMLQVFCITSVLLECYTLFLFK